MTEVDETSELAPARRSRRWRRPAWRRPALLPHGYLGWTLGVLALLACITAAVGLGSHFHTPHGTYTLGLSAASPYLMLGAPVALILVLAARYWVGAVIPLVLTIIAVITQVPLYTSTAVPAGSRSVVVMTSNLRLGLARPADVVSEVRKHHVEVLMLEELTEAEQAALGAAGLDKLLPYHVSDPQGAALGTGLWSRYPLSEQTKRGDFSFAFVTARVAIPGVAHPPLAVAAHMAGPYPDSADWLKDMAHLPSVLSSLADSASTLVGGDFNATPDVVQFRHLLRDGYADAADQAGAGVTATWPTDQWYGPVIAIDHVLTRHAVATSADTLSIANTDHRALLVKVAVPRS